MGGETERDFPKPIIQHIQSFLTGKEAARTTILSKSWHRAWLTGPHLDLDDDRFYENEFWLSKNKYGIGEFSKYAKKTIERYEQSNLKIESFNLCMRIDCYASAKLANKLLVKALTKLGATRLSFVLGGYSKKFDLPCEVVFGADNLVDLSLKNCIVPLDGIVIKCFRLESLSLDGVDTTRDGLCTIISSCPLIEKLSLSKITYHQGYVDYGDYQVWATSSAASATCPTINNLDYKLKYLVLCYDSFRDLFPGDLLSKFPFLTDFTLLNMDGYGAGDEVQISNCSLENIKIEIGKEARRRGNWGAEDDHRLKVRLDVPNIQNFTFEGGDVIPKLSFVSSSPTRESHVSVKENNTFGGPAVVWFRELNEFLTELRQSKINLSLHVGSSVFLDYRVGVLNFDHKHELESLTIDLTGLPSLGYYALLDGLFRLCRPKLIFPERETSIDLVWQALEQGMHASIPTQFMYGLNDLEEVNAQIFDDDVMEWRSPIPLKSFLLEVFANQQRVRLLLKWKPS